MNAWCIAVLNEKTILLLVSGTGITIAAWVPSLPDSFWELVISLGMLALDALGYGLTGWSDWSIVISVQIVALLWLAYVQWNVRMPNDDDKERAMYE